MRGFQAWGRVLLLAGAIAVVVGATVFLAGGERPLSPVSAEPAVDTPDPGELTCTLEVDKTVIAPGETVRCSVRIHNGTGRTIGLLARVDGSPPSVGYPVCGFKIDGPQEVFERPMFRCGNRMFLQQLERVEVKPGESLDPYRGGYEEDRSLQLNLSGRHTVRFSYATDLGGTPDWNMLLGSSCPPEAGERFREQYARVLKVKLESNPVTITVTGNVTAGRHPDLDRIYRETFELFRLDHDDGQWGEAIRFWRKTCVNADDVFKDDRERAGKMLERIELRAVIAANLAAERAWKEFKENGKERALGYVRSQRPRFAGTGRAEERLASLIQEMEAKAVNR